MLGTVKIQVWRGSFTCLLLCRLVESRRCCPILGKSVCEGMDVVEIKDSDAIWRPHTSGGQVFSVEDVVSTMEDKNPWNGYVKTSFHTLYLSNIQM